MKKFLEEQQFTFPMMLGNPRQRPVKTFKDFIHHVNLWNENYACFMSINGTPSWKKYKYISKEKEREKILATSINMNHIFFDLDSENDLNSTLLDIRKLQKFCVDNRLNYLCNFTGGKGFQFFIHLKPQIYKFNIENGSRENLEKYFRVIILWLEDRLELKTVDHNSIEPKKLSRITTTRHVNRKGEVSETYCFTLTDEMFHWSIEKIKQYSLNKPNIINEKLKYKNKYTLIDFIKYFKINIKEIIKNHKYVDYKPINIDNEVFVLLDEICSNYPCVIYHLKTSHNPLHKVRIAFCLLCKQRGIHPNELNDIWVKVGNIIGYEDINDYDYRMEQINSIYDNGRYIKPPTCSTLSCYGICIKENCKKWRKHG